MERTLQDQERARLDQIGRVIVNAALDVHRALGPGLLESAYQKCLAYELACQGLRVECEVQLPVTYREIQIEMGYRIDMLVEDAVIIENKTVETLLPVHDAQILTYMKLRGCRLGYLINWNVERILVEGLKRKVYKF